MPIHVKARHLLVSAVAVGVFSLPAFARTSPSENTQTTVAEALKNPVGDQGVQIQGHLLRQATFDRYIFSDGTGEIVAKIKSSRFPGLSFDAATNIVLTGEIDRSNQQPEIEVKSVKVID